MVFSSKYLSLNFCYVHISLLIPKNLQFWILARAVKEFHSNTGIESYIICTYIVIIIFIRKVILHRITSGLIGALQTL